MCGRYTLTTSVDELARHFGLSGPPAVTARYNIAPTQPVATVLVLTGDREFRLMRWGLIPAWSGDPAIAGRLINARAETVADKPAFRDAFRHRRCLILADGFYEWLRQGKARLPYYVTRRDRGPFAFAGLWDRWSPPGGGPPIESCTIITTDANALVRPFHQRMPVILAPAHYDAWLNPATDPASLRPLLSPCPAEHLEAYPVSTLVNSPAHETSECTRPIAPGEAVTGTEQLRGQST